MGPLSGLRVVEFSAIGPAPYAVMLLADMGAEILRIEREDAPWPNLPIISRGRASLMLDLKDPDHAESARSAIRHADVLVEGFRPGVMERLGLGPEDMTAANPALVYARVTGWGQSGPLAQVAGHDINYIALTGLLALLQRSGAPQAPQNLLGDYAAGSLFLVIGILAALLERQRSGRGQIVDAAIVDGASSLLSPILGMDRAGLLGPDPAQGMLSGSAPYYGVYRCSDGGYVAVGPLEAPFRRLLTDKLSLEPNAIDGDPKAARRRLSEIFAAHPRQHWERLFAGSDACVTPVLSVEEAMADPHLSTRKTFGGSPDGVVPMPAPRFSRTPGSLACDADGLEMLKAWQNGPRPAAGGF